MIRLVNIYQSYHIYNIKTSFKHTSYTCNKIMILQEEKEMNKIKYRLIEFEGMLFWQRISDGKLVKRAYYW